MSPKERVEAGTRACVKGIVRFAVATCVLTLTVGWLFPAANQALGLAYLPGDGAVVLSNPTMLVAVARHTETYYVPVLATYPLVGFTLAMLVPIRRRLVAWAGALAGYLAGWWAAVFWFGRGAEVPLGVWGAKVGLVALCAMVIVSGFESGLVLLDRVLARPKITRVWVPALVVIATVIAYSNISEYVGERLDMRTDRSQMRRVYRALIMYELDYDGQSATSLVDVAPTYIEPQELSSPADSRPVPKLGLYPANLYVFKGPGSERMVPTRISYAYARAFEPQFKWLVPWPDYQDCPEGAVLTNTQYRYSRRPPVGTPTPAIHGAYTDRGPLMRIMNDGSLRVLEVPRSCPTPFGAYEMLFFANETGKVKWDDFRPSYGKPVALLLSTGR